MIMPSWLKSTAAILCVMILWDICRLFIQAKVNQWMLRKNFSQIEKDLDDLEEDVEDLNEPEVPDEVFGYTLAELKKIINFAKSKRYAAALKGEKNE